MDIHRFACGEDVVLQAGVLPRSNGGVIYTITELLPFEGSIPRYRVKSAGEKFSRVALEDTLRVSAEARSTVPLRAAALFSRLPHR